MKCPNCGFEMPEGVLYCEHCGEDIHIVPDFEPELERNLEETMEQTISNVLEELHEGMAGGGESGPEGESEYEEPEDDRGVVHKKRLWPKILLTFVFMLLFAAGAVGWYIYSYNSEER